MVRLSVKQSQSSRIQNSNLHQGRDHLSSSVGKLAQHLAPLTWLLLNSSGSSHTSFLKLPAPFFFSQKEWKHFLLKRNRNRAHKGAQVAWNLVSLQINMLSFKTDKECNDVKRKIPKTFQSTRVSISISLILRSCCTSTKLRTALFFSCNNFILCERNGTLLY